LTVGSTSFSFDNFDITLNQLSRQQVFVLLK
jgi:hypothetical protein